MKENTAYYCIKEPYWKIKGFGLAKENMGKRKTIVSVKLKKQDGTFTFPNSYVIKTKDAMQCEMGNAGSGSKRVHLIPFAICKEIPRTKRARRCK